MAVLFGAFTLHHSFHLNLRFFSLSRFNLCTKRSLFSLIAEAFTAVLFAVYICFWGCVFAPLLFFLGTFLFAQL